ncbi:hypothetical protein RFI_14102, partial [Reticulomyxa filosa]
SEEYYLGLECLEPVSEGHDGKVKNSRYFKCMPGYGVLVSVFKFIKKFNASDIKAVFLFLSYQIQDFVSMLSNYLEQRKEKRRAKKKKKKIHMYKLHKYIIIIITIIINKIINRKRNEDSKIGQSIAYSSDSAIQKKHKSEEKGASKKHENARSNIKKGKISGNEPFYFRRGSKRQSNLIDNQPHLKDAMSDSASEAGRHHQRPFHSAGSRSWLDINYSSHSNGSIPKSINEKSGSAHSVLLDNHTRNGTDDGSLPSTDFGLHPLSPTAAHGSIEKRNKKDTMGTHKWLDRPLVRQSSASNSNSSVQSHSDYGNAHDNDENGNEAADEEHDGKAVEHEHEHGHTNENEPEHDNANDNEDNESSASSISLENDRKTKKKKTQRVQIASTQPSPSPPEVKSKTDQWQETRKEEANSLQSLDVSDVIPDESIDSDMMKRRSTKISLVANPRLFFNDSFSNRHRSQRFRDSFVRQPPGLFRMGTNDSQNYGEAKHTSTITPVLEDVADNCTDSAALSELYIYMYIHMYVYIYVYVCHCYIDLLDNIIIHGGGSSNSRFSYITVELSETMSNRGFLPANPELKNRVESSGEAKIAFASTSCEVEVHMPLQCTVQMLSKYLGALKPTFVLTGQATPNGQHQLVTAIFNKQIEATIAISMLQLENITATLKN